MVRLCSCNDRCYLNVSRIFGNCSIRDGLDLITTHLVLYFLDESQQHEMSDLNQVRDYLIGYLKIDMANHPMCKNLNHAGEC